MQVFRIMDMPDRVLAFDELPERLLKGFEMCRAEGFPRHWKEWLGKIEKLTPIPPEKDLMTGNIRRFDPIVEKDSYFYLVDWTLNPVMEKWKEVSDFVRQHVDKDTRLMEKIEDMAVPLAANKTDGVSLEPEEVPIIKIPLQYQEKDGKQVILPKAQQIPTEMLKCPEEGCSFESEKKAAIRMHVMKKHPKVIAQPVA